MLTSTDPKLLREIPLFQNLTPEQLGTIGKLWHPRIFATGTIIMTADRPGDTVYIVLEGSVKIFTQDRQGQESILGLRGPGEVLGEISLIDNLSRSADIVTLEKCLLLSADRMALQQHLLETPVMLLNLSHILASRLRLAGAQIQAMATLDIRGRLARQILALAEESGQKTESGAILIPIRIPQSDLASMVGASRVSVNQTIASWKQRKYVSFDSRHRLTVLDATALAKEIQ